MKKVVVVTILLALVSSCLCAGCFPRPGATETAAAKSTEEAIIGEWIELEAAIAAEKDTPIIGVSGSIHEFYGDGKGSFKWETNGGSHSRELTYEVDGNRVYIYNQEGKATGSYYYIPKMDTLVSDSVYEMFKDDIELANDVFSLTQAGVLVRWNE